MSPATHSLGGVSGLSGVLENDDYNPVQEESTKIEGRGKLDVIDVTPETIEHSKLSKSKVLITLSGAVERGGVGCFVATLVNDLRGKQFIEVHGKANEVRERGGGHI